MKFSLNLKLQTTFYFFFYPLLLLLFVKYVMLINIPKMVFLALIFAIVCFGGKTEIITMCLLGIPLYSTIEIYFTILICMIVYAVKYHKSMKIGLEVLPIVGLFAWEIMHCLCNDYINNASFVFIFPYLFCVLVMFNCAKEVNYTFVIRNYALCTIWMCIIVLGKLVKNTGLNIMNALAQTGRFGYSSIVESEAYFNPNTLGFFCIIAMIGLLQLILAKKGKLTDGILVIILLFFGCLTMSITYYVCLIFMIALFFIAVLKNKKESIKFIIMGLVIIVVSIIALNKFSPTLMNNLMSRVLVDDISNGRVGLFMQYGKYIMSSLLTLFWGTGIAKNCNLVEEYFMTSNMQVPHNGVQEVLVIWGIPGLIIFVVFLGSLILNAKKQLNNPTLLNYIPLIMILFKVQAGQLATSYPTILMFSLAYLSLCNDLKKEVHR